MGKHTESHEDTSNLLESGEKHSDEIPSEGGWSDRSIVSACDLRRMNLEQTYR